MPRDTDAAGVALYAHRQTALPTITLEDMLAATKAVAAGASMQWIIGAAEDAARHRKQHGVLHSAYGDGSIGAAAYAAMTRRPAPPAGSINDARYLRALAAAATALADYREAL